MTDGNSQNRPSAELLAALQRIEERLERLEDSGERAREFGEALPGTLATVVDSVDERIEGLSARGVDVDDRA